MQKQHLKPSALKPQSSTLAENQSRRPVTDRSEKHPNDAVNDNSSLASNDRQALVSAMERGRYSSLLAQISRSKMRKVEVPASLAICDAF